MYLEILFCATFSLCSPVISSHGLVVEEKPPKLTNNEFLFDIVGNMNESTKTSGESAISQAYHNEKNTQEETTEGQLLKILEITAFSNKTADFRNTTIPIKFNAQLVKKTDKDYNFLSPTGLAPVIINEKSNDNRILFSDEAKALENQKHIYPNFNEKIDFLVDIAEPQPQISKAISMEKAELPPTLGSSEKKNIEAPKAEKYVETYGLPFAFRTTQVTAERLNLETTNLEKNHTLGGIIEPSGQGYEKPTKISVDLLAPHDSLEQNKMEMQLLHNATNKTEDHGSQVYNITEFDLRAVFNVKSDFEESFTPSTPALNATTTQTVSPILKTATNFVEGIGNTKIKPILLKNFTTGTAMTRPFRMPNRQKQASSAWYTNLIAFHPTYLLNPFNYFYNSTNQNFFGLGSPASSWHYSNLLKSPFLNFTNLLNTTFLTDSSSSARHDRGFLRRSNVTKWHFFPFFKLFNTITRFNRTKFASKTNIKSAVNNSDLLSGLFPPSNATSKYLQESEGRSAAENKTEVFERRQWYKPMINENSEQSKDTSTLRYSNESPFYHSEANQLRTSFVMYIGGRPQYYQGTAFSNKHLQYFRKVNYLEQRTPIYHSDQRYNEERPRNADRQKSVDVTVSEEEQSSYRGGQPNETVKSVIDTPKMTTTSLKV